MAQRIISAREVVEDVKAGMTDAAIIEKYDLSDRSLKAIYKKLLNWGSLTIEDLKRRQTVAHAGIDEPATITPLQSSKVHKDSEKSSEIEQRSNPRADLYVPLPVYELGSSRFGVVKDVSESGLCVAGIPSLVGEVKSFQLPIDSFMNADPLLLVAECRWVEKRGNKDKDVVAGFQLLDLSDADRTSLKNLIHFLLLSISGEWQTRVSRDDGNPRDSGSD